MPLPPPPPPRPFPQSLCHACAGCAYVGGKGGQVYLRCERLPERYPRQPTRACLAYAPPRAALLSLDALAPPAGGGLPLRWLAGEAGGGRWRGALNAPLSAEELAGLAGLGLGLAGLGLAGLGLAGPRGGGEAQHPGGALVLTPHGAEEARAPAAWALRWAEEPARALTLALALRPPTPQERRALLAPAAPLTLTLDPAPAARPR